MTKSEKELREVGRPKGQMTKGTLCTYYGNIDYKTFNNWVMGHPELQKEIFKNYPNWPNMRVLPPALVDKIIDCLGEN